MCDSIAFERQS